MVELYYNCSIDESSKHSPFEVSCGFQFATLADRLLPLTGAPSSAADRLTDHDFASTRDVVRELLTLSKQRMVSRSSRPASICFIGDFVFLSSKGLHIHSKQMQTFKGSTSWSI